MEIGGPLGMFADPATGGNATSFPLPPPSACIGMIESICRFPGVDVEIQAVALCGNITFQSFGYNKSVGPNRKPGLKNSWQVSSTLLKNPVFQIIAILKNNQSKAVKHNNNAHAMQDRFLRRLRKGQSFRTPTLGHREFIAEYVGEPKTPVNTSLNFEITAFPFGNLLFGANFRKLVVKNGVAIYDEKYQASLDNGLLSL